MNAPPAKKAARVTLNPMTPLERRSVTVLSSIYGLRVLGLFLVLPLLSIYAAHLKGATPLLVGVAFGVYGLTQALLQIPLGMLSDRIGRKPVIVSGLLAFAIGSVVAAASTSIYGMVIGRAIQGAGVISSATMALVADLTRDEQRTKAMAIIGGSIGGSFILSIILSPFLNNAIGVAGIFWLTAVMASVAIAVLLLRIPTPTRRHHEIEADQFRRILTDRQLLRLDFGIFCQHLAITSMFLVLPPIIVKYAGMPLHEHWKIYLPVMLLALVGMAPFVRGSARGAKTRRTLVGAVVVLLAAELIYRFFYHHLSGIMIGLWLFFTAFSILEAMLPSLISRLAPAHARGAAIGVYSTFQGLGVPIGSIVGGFLVEHYGPAAVFDFAIAMLLLWVLVAATMTEPKLLTTYLCRIRTEVFARNPAIADTLSSVAGVVEVVWVQEERTAYLRVDPDQFDERQLDPWREPEFQS